jgi:hypothetical protein
VVAGDAVSNILAETLDEILADLKVFNSQSIRESFKRTVISEFFEKTNPAECNKDGVIPPVCFKFYQGIYRTGALTVNFSDIFYFGNTTKISVTNPLRESEFSRSPLLIKQDSRNVFTPSEDDTLNNTLHTLREGDLLSLDVRQIRQSSYTLGKADIKNTHNEVCTKFHTECKEGSWKCTNPNTEQYNCRSVCQPGPRQCACNGRVMNDDVNCGAVKLIGCEFRSTCSGYSSVCDERRVCDRLVPPLPPNLPYRQDLGSPYAADFTWSCSQQSDDVCDPSDKVDQWSRITTYPRPANGSALANRPFTADDQKLLASGLNLRFSNGVECPLSALIVDDSKLGQILFKAQNTKDCQIFDSKSRVPYHGPKFWIINKIRAASTFQCGQLYESYNGERTYTCVLPDGSIKTLKSSVKEDIEAASNGSVVGIHLPYYPQTEIEADLRIVGGFFDASN